MEILRLLEELDNLTLAQKTLLGMTYSFHQEDFLALTNKIRATMVPLSSPDLFLDRVTEVLARHLRSQEEVIAIMNEIRVATGTMP